MKLTKCRSCGAPIFFRHTEGGSMMPLDVEPLKSYGAGAMVLEGPGGCRSAKPLLDVGKPMYRSHFATCPQADRFRSTR